MPSEGNNPRPKTIRRKPEKKETFQKPRNKPGQQSTQDGYNPIISFPLNKKKKNRPSAKANKQTAETRKGKEEIQNFLQDLPSTKICNIKKEKEKDLEYYFKNHHLLAGRKRYIDISGGRDPDAKQFFVYAFDLKKQIQIAILEDDWYEKKLYKAKLSEKEFKSLIKCQRAFNKKE